MDLLPRHRGRPGGVRSLHLAPGLSRDESAGLEIKFSVIVPTFGRAGHLKRCLAALEKQTRVPDEVLVVLRPEDEATGRELNSWRASSRLAVREAFVDRPGNILPVIVGLREVSGDVAALTDDDAEPYPDWLERLERNYGSSDVGGVGGSLEEYVEEKRIELPGIDRVGYLKWFGDYYGGFHRVAPTRPPFEVDFLRGANMSYRTSVWREVGVDPILNLADYHFEVDIGLRVRRKGFRIICDPAARVRHYNAGRTLQTVYGTPPPDLMKRRSHNFAYAMSKNLPLARLPAFWAWLLLVGNKSSWGLLYFLVAGWRQVDGLRWARLAAAYRGKAEGLKAYLRSIKTLGHG